MITKRDEQHGFLQFDVENLERRRLLAGNVTASIAGGSLTLDGDAQDNILAVTQLNGDYVVIGVDTSIADADLSTDFLGIDIDIKIIEGVTKDIVAILRGGDDTFLFGGAIEELDPEDLFTSDEISVGPAMLGRDLKIFTNGGRDTVVITGADVERDVRIDTGFGLEDVVAVGGGGVAMGILDLLQNFDLQPDALQDGGIPDVALDIINTIFGSVEVGRDLFISGESSDDTVYVGGASVGRDAIIHTNIGEDVVHFGTGAVIEVILFDGPGADQGFGDIFEFLSQIEISAEVSVGRNAHIRTGDQDDVATIGGAELYSFDLSGFDPEIAEGPGGFALVLEISGGVTVENNFTLDVSAHDDSAYIGVRPRFDFIDFPTGRPAEDGGDGSYDVRVGRNMKVLTLADDDFLQIGGSQGLVEDAWFGNHSSQGVLQVERNLSIDTGAGTDEIILGETDPLIVPDSEVTRRGGDSVFYQIDIGNDLTINTGSHDDHATIAGTPFLWQYDDGGFGEMSEAGNLYVGRDFKANTAGGNDNFRLGYSEIYNDFPELNAANAFENSSAVSIGRDLLLLTGDQDDGVMIDSTYVEDDATIRTWWGRDELSIGYNSSVFIGDRLTVDTSLERDTIGMIDSYVGGNAVFNTGLRDDNLLMSNSSIGGNLTANTDRGNDFVDLQNVDVEGVLRLNTGRENDTVEIFETTASRLFVIAGADDDHVCVFDSMFTDGATLNGGSGDADALGENLLSPTIISFENFADCLDED